MGSIYTDTPGKCGNTFCNDIITNIYLQLKNRCIEEMLLATMVYLLHRVCGRTKCLHFIRDERTLVVISATSALLFIFIARVCALRVPKYQYSKLLRLKCGEANAGENSCTRVREQSNKNYRADNRYRNAVFFTVSNLRPLSSSLLPLSLMMKRDFLFFCCCSVLSFKVISI